MEMPEVQKCLAHECAYNLSNICHALAITISGDPEPKCDTYCQSDQKGGDMSGSAKVGACKASHCTYNNCLECQASGIRVGYHNNQGICLTVEKKCFQTENSPLIKDTVDF